MSRRLPILMCLILVTAVVGAALAPTSAAQEVNPGTESGLPPFGSFSGSDFDKINLQNGSLHIEIPIVSVTERGRTLSWNFVYDTPTWSKVWFLQPTPQNPYAGHYFVQGPDGEGWRLSGPFDWTVRSAFAQSQTCPLGTNPPIIYNLWSEYMLVDPTGTPHQLPLRKESRLCLGQTLSGPTMDGTGITYDDTTKTIKLKDGTQIKFPNPPPGSTTIQDANGNLATGVGSLAGPQDPNGRPGPGSIQDMFGRQLITVTQGPQTTYTSPLGINLTGNSYTLIQVLDSSGAQQTYRVDYVAVDYQTSMCSIFGGSSNCTETAGALLQARQLTLPNGKTYVFAYNNNTFLDMASITLPTGGSIAYTLSGPSPFAQPSSNPKIPPTFIGPRSVSTRTVNNGGTSLQSQYSLGTVTFPTGDVEVHSFGQVVIGNQFSPQRVEKSVTYKNSSGTVLKTVTTDWTGAVDPWNGGIKNLQPIRQTTTLDNGLATKRETDYETFQYGCSGSSCLGTATRLNPTEVREYAFGSGSPGALLRKTDYTYLHTGSTTYQNLNVVNRVTTTIVRDASGNQVAKKVSEYDNYTQGISASGAIQHSSSFGISYTTRGNATATSHWRNTDGALLLTRRQFDDTGNVLSTTDPKSNTTLFDYADSWTTQTGGNACAPGSGQTKGYLTKITDPFGHIARHSHYSCSGLIGSTTDPNSQTTSQNYDLFDRPLVTSYPDGGQIVETYDDTNLIVTTARVVQQGSYVYSLDRFDQIGQHIERDLCEDGSAACSLPIATTFSYDGKGRVTSRTNPCRPTPDASCGTTQYQYDAIERRTLVIPPDGSPSSNNVRTQYCNNSVLVIDEAGKWHRSISDALGRLIEVDEPNSATASVGPCPVSGDPTVVTTYGYDLLGNVTSVLQNASRQRTFVYNSLSQLLSETEPESGTTCYGTVVSGVCQPNGYDDDGNVIKKTDARSITATYSYDALNRLTQKSYSDSTPTVKYGYDGGAPSGCTPPALTVTNGVTQRTSMCDGAGAEAWSYDPLGRVLTDLRTTNGVTKSTSYGYNLDGSLHQLTYPTGHTITYPVDSASRPIAATDVPNGTSYVANAQYGPGGGISSLTNGASLVSTEYYNNRLQPCRISVKSFGASPTQCSDTTNVGDVLDLSYDFSLGTSDDGDVTAITNNRDTTRTQSFTYDHLNRLATARTASTFATSPVHCWGENYSYDPWGNLLSIGVVSSSYNGCTQEGLNVSVTSSNQISGYCYDAAGNFLAQSAAPCPSPTYTYNAENQLTSTAGVTYAYDGQGKRVSKSNGTLYWYGMGNDTLVETDLSGNLTNEYVFFVGRRIARRDASGNVNYYLADHIGTARVVTSAAGTILDDSDFYPFGGERVVASSSGNRYKFTGKERDVESGLDDFGARYDSSWIGRFMSPDVGTYHFENPQSLNRYTYALDNPLFYVDPDGFDPQKATTVNLGTFVQPSWEEIGDEKLRILGGANGKGGPDAEADAVFEINNNYIYNGSLSLNISVTFSGNDENMTASISTFDPVDPQPPKFDVPRGTHRMFGPTQHPNDPTVIRIDTQSLQGLSDAQLRALEASVRSKLVGPIQRALLDAIAEEKKRREEARKKQKEEEERKKNKPKCVENLWGQSPCTK